VNNWRFYFCGYSANFSFFLKICFLVSWIMIVKDVDREKERVVTLYQGSSENIYRRDYREDELFVTIESLRCELLEVAEQRSLSDHTVLELSERLDSYILLAQHKMMENLRNRKSGAAAYG
jgi:hypothetical protein